jgi:zona occludens toxin
MISLLTGLPGNGKTLFALWYIKQKAEKEQREVYYHNIKDLTLPWSVFEAKEWKSLPAGSIVVIDEAQDIFPKMPNGAKLPEFYTDLAKHRHSGFDIYLITQHPSLLDNFVRQLVGQHFHTIRKFGMQRSTVYEWRACQPAPQNPSSHKNAISMKWAYPKEVFTYYKSAEVHTVVRSIPPKLVAAVILVFALLGFGYWSMSSFQKRHGLSEKSSPDKIVESKVESTGAVSESINKAHSFNAIEDAKNYVAMNTARVQGFPQTAPKYDELTKPTTVPVPAMCVQIGDITKETPRCKCYTQQATPIEMPFNQCVEIAQHGFFLDFDPNSGRQQAARAEVSREVLSSRPDADLPGRQLAQVTVLPDLTVNRPVDRVRVTGDTSLR